MICKQLIRGSVVAVAAFAGLAGAHAQSRSGGSDQQAVQLLQAIEQKYGNVPSVTGSFTQVLHEPAFGKGKPMNATFSLLKPKDFKIEYTTPEPNVTLVTGGSLYKYVPKLKQVTKHNLKQADLHYLALGFGARTSDILNIYNVKGSREGIQLQPKRSKGSQFNSMTIDVDPNELVPEKFTVEQSDGTKIELAINKSSLRFNVPLSQRDFRPSFPRDAQVVDME